MLESCVDDFGPFDGRTWMNNSHQGPLPRVAVEAVHRALSFKINPTYLKTSEHFNSVPLRLRIALGKMFNANADDIILGNSTSYGIQLIANSMNFNAGDEILLVEGDFPATIFPWYVLRDQGVKITMIKPAGLWLTPDELQQSLNKNTKVFCTNWVHSFKGSAVDEVAMAKICTANGTRFILNGSQAFGARPFDVSTTKVDAIVGCGFKWMCGPYGTGFCWIKPELREQLNMTKCYWLANITADDLKGEFKVEPPESKDNISARAFDIFGTANFNNFMPWTASIEYLLEKSINEVANHDQELVSHLINTLDSDQFEVLSPQDEPHRGTMVIISHQNKDANPALFKSLSDAGIDIALRQGNLRFSPHLYNTIEDLDKAVTILNNKKIAIST